MKKIKKNLLLISLCSILVLTAGCGKIPKLENGQEVVASIDGKQVAVEELYNELKNQYGTGILVNIIDEFIASKEIETDQSAKDYAESQITMLKNQYAQLGKDFNSALISSGYKDENELKESIMLDYKKNIVAENYVKETLTESEINDYYEKNIYGEISVKHILIKPETTSSMSEEEKTAAENAALEEAKTVIQKLSEGADFDALVKEYSDDTASVSENGLIADFSKDEVVSEFFDASLNLQDGEYTKEPVKTTYGYHIILKVSQKEKPALEDVLDTVKDSLCDEKFDNDSNLFQKSWVEIRKKYSFNIVDTDIKSIYDATISSLK